MKSLVAALKQEVARAGLLACRRSQNRFGSHPTLRSGQLEIRLGAGVSVRRFPGAGPARAEHRLPAVMRRPDPDRQRSGVGRPPQSPLTSPPQKSVTKPSQRNLTVESPGRQRGGFSSFTRPGAASGTSFSFPLLGSFLAGSVWRDLQGNWLPGFAVEFHPLACLKRLCR